MTMFPETICEGEEVPSTQMVPSHHTNLQRLAQPAQILKAAISGLATYQVGGCVCLEKGEGRFEQLIVIVCGVYLCVSSYLHNSMLAVYLLYMSDMQL